MITNAFEALMEELGKALEIPNFTPDEKETCLLRIEGNVDIQLEPDQDERFLLMATDFGEIPLGRYRLDLLETALKMNALPPPLNGIFSYSTKADHFVLFDKIPLKDLSGENLADHIAKFNEKAKIWKEAIENSEVPVISEVTTSDHVNIFGIRS